MGSNMGTRTNEEREQCILAMEEELRLLKGQSPQSSNFSGFAPLCTPVGGVSLAGSEATQGPHLNEPKQKLEMGGSRHDHDRWLLNGRLYLEAHRWLTNAQHVAYFTCQHVGAALGPSFVQSFKQVTLLIGMRLKLGSAAFNPNPTMMSWTDWSTCLSMNGQSLNTSVNLTLCWLRCRWTSPWMIACCSEPFARDWTKH